MTSIQTMDYYVRPRHLYSHSRTCTRSGLCRRPSRLVESTICYLLDHASVHEISALVTCSSICQTFPTTMETLICYISSAYVEIIVLLYIFIMEIPIYVYCTWRWLYMFYHFSCLFMAIVLLCIRDCSMYLQLYAKLYYGIMLIGWLVFHLGTFITSLLGWTYNVFRPSYNPSNIIH